LICNLSKYPPPALNTYPLDPPVKKMNYNASNSLLTANFS